MKNIVTIGGGTGQPLTLRALRDIPGINIKAIVTTLDDGGSTGRLREELGILAPGDSMKCLLGLSKYDLQNFFTRRFSTPDKINGHSVGNMLLAMLIGYTGNFEKGVEALADVLEVKGEVIPASLEKGILVAEYADGSVVKSEHLIDEPVKSGKICKITDLWVEPMLSANPKAIKAILNADYIFLGPGDFYTSILANLVIPKIHDSIKKSKAKLVYIANLMSKKGQITDMKLSDLCQEIEKYVQRKVSAVIVNNSQIPAEILSHYSKYEEKLIENDLSDSDIRLFVADIVDNLKIEKDKNDKLTRSVLRHSAIKLNGVIKKIIA